MKHFFGTYLFLAAVALVLAKDAAAYDPVNKTVTGHELPEEIKGVGIDEKLGDRIDLNLAFTDETGKAVKLGDYFGGKPVLLSIVYYNCASLCNYHLNGLTDAMKKMSWTVGDEFELVAITMNHREDADLASQKKAAYVKDYGRPSSAKGWHFLTGTEANIKKIADQTGFRFKWLPAQNEYSHASAATIMTPDGTISRYLHGVMFDPNTVKMALLEAADGKVGTFIERALLFCFQFDPKKSKFVLYSWRLMQVGGVLIVLMMGLILVPLWMGEKKVVQQS